jgi:hypothetical protein
VDLVDTVDKMQVRVCEVSSVTHVVEFGDMEGDKVIWMRCGDEPSSTLLCGMQSSTHHPDSDHITAVFITLAHDLGTYYKPQSLSSQLALPLSWLLPVTDSVSAAARLPPQPASGRCNNLEGAVHT